MCFHYCTSISTTRISTEARYADEIQFIVHHSDIPYVGRPWGLFDRIEIIQRDWHKCRGHCSNILYINMLAIEHEEYSILISEVCN
ncbi:hypothetical protein T4C_11816, partial [Trichinella pseudospiralis]